MGHGQVLLFPSLHEKVQFHDKDGKTASTQHNIKKRHVHLEEGFS